MNRQIKQPAVIVAFVIQFCITFLFAQAENESKLNINPGLALKILEAPVKSDYGDSRITVLKIDPEFYDINIYCASQLDQKSRTVKTWASEFKLTAVINAGMYAADHLTSVGFMKSGEHLNNRNLNKTYNCVFACAPLEENVPQAQIIDLKCQDFKIWKSKYLSFSQSIRMISCRQKNVWQQQPRKWSIAALAVDKEGDLLFIHCRSPYSVHDFIEMLLQLPLNIYNAMYLEGGPEASLYFSAGDFEKELFGSYETGFILNDQNASAWKIPNVIGIRPRKR